MKYLLAFILLLMSCTSMAKVQFNVAVGRDFQTPFSDSFDSVYFQSVGDAVTVEKVVVRTKSAECELFVPMRAPMKFNWGRRWSMPMWDCKHKEIVSVAIYTETHIYTYGI